VKSAAPSQWLQNTYPTRATAGTKSVPLEASGC
jgi:hypothetical protein